MTPQPIVEPKAHVSHPQGCEFTSGAPVSQRGEEDMSKTAEFSSRGSKSGRTRRMRIYSLHDDQIELIQLALEIARRDSDTEYDSVALTNICMDFLAGCPSGGPTQAYGADQSMIIGQSAKDANSKKCTCVHKLEKAS
jgi:hypothetical protein